MTIFQAITFTFTLYTFGMPDMPWYAMPIKWLQTD